MKYKLKRDIPFTWNNRELKIGDIIDDSDKNYEPLWEDVIVINNITKK